MSNNDKQASVDELLKAFGELCDAVSEHVPEGKKRSKGYNYLQDARSLFLQAIGEKDD